jgi:M6 family metalloprotease-like protein
MRFPIGLVILPLLAFGLYAADDEYRTVDTAIVAKPQAAAPSVSPVVMQGHLGVLVQANAKGQAVIEDVEAESVAEKAGLKISDVIAKVDGKEIASVEAFRTLLRSKSAGERFKLTVTRQSKSVDMTIVLAPSSRPMASVITQPSLLGVNVTALTEGDGVKIEQIVPGSAAEKAKLKVGETILKLDDVPITGPDKLRALLDMRSVGETVNLTLMLADKSVEYKVKLSEVERPGRPGGAGAGVRGGGWNRYWTKPAYRIAIILVEYPDVKHGEKIPPSAWAEAMFSTGGKYTKSPTGQTTYGSMHDYYFEQSYGQLKIEGKAFDYLKMDKNRMDYNTGERTALLKEAMDKLLAREGKDALKDFDGVFFIYAGGRTNAARGSLYWPHKSNFSHNGKSWPYFICMETDARSGGMANISVFCHEFGHILGLPDLYARPEAPGMEGVGIWCAMANQAGQGRPQHFSAWCKEKLGWIKPVTIDPTVPQKLLLGPIEDSPKECFKILLRPDASEYYLLENRKRKGFDTSLPEEGLLVWRVIGNRPVLEEAHGIAGPQGPGRFLKSVPFPNEANSSFTPYTIPSSRSQLGGGPAVFITNITKRPDGKIAFHIGYEYQ